MALGGTLMQPDDLAILVGWISLFMLLIFYLAYLAQRHRNKRAFFDVWDVFLSAIVLIPVNLLGWDWFLDLGAYIAAPMIIVLLTAAATFRSLIIKILPRTPLHDQLAAFLRILAVLMSVVGVFGIISVYVSQTRGEPTFDPSRVSGLLRIGALACLVLCLLIDLLERRRHRRSITD